MVVLIAAGVLQDNLQLSQRGGLGQSDLPGVATDQSFGPDGETVTDHDQTSSRMGTRGLFSLTAQPLISLSAREVNCEGSFRALSYCSLRRTQSSWAIFKTLSASVAVSGRR